MGGGVSVGWGAEPSGIKRFELNRPETSKDATRFNIDF